MMDFLKRLFGSEPEGENVEKAEMPSGEVETQGEPEIGPDSEE